MNFLFRDRDYKKELKDNLTNLKKLKEILSKHPKLVNEVVLLELSSNLLIFLIPSPRC